MNELFKQFRENWKNRPEPVFEEQDWQALEKRLDYQPEKPARGSLMWWFLVPFLLLLFGSNIWSLSELQKANQKIIALTIQKDTIYKSQIIFQSDTIYQTRIIRETLQVETYAATRGFKNLFDFHSPPLGSREKEEGFSTILLSQIKMTKDSLSSSSENDTSNDQSVFDSELAYLELIQPRQMSVRDPAFPYEANLVSQKKKTIPQHVYSMRPKGFQLGVGGGWVNPIDQTDDIIQRAGYSLGLHSAIDFSNNLRLWLDASFSETQYEAYRMDETLGVLAIDPPSDEFTFFKAEVPQLSLNYSIGMDYSFDLKGNFKPFFGAGYGAAILLADETTYEFRNDLLDLVVTVDHPNLGRTVYSDLYLLRTGFDFQASKHWNWRLWATYRSKWSEHNVQIPRIFSVQSGLMYRF